MSEWMRKILESKRAKREQLRLQPFGEKVKILEQLRDRTLSIAKSPLRRKFSQSK